MKLAYLFIFFTSAAVGSFTVIDNVFFLDAGYSLGFIGLMASVFNIAVAVSELPFALLFDRFSNKRAVQIGNAIRIIALCLFFLNLGHAELIVAQALAGVAVATSSGTSQSLVVNALRSSNPKDIAQVFGRITYISAGGGIVGGVIGGILYNVHQPSIWLLAIGFMAAAAYSIALFEDVQADEDRIPVREYLRSVSRVLSQQFFWILVFCNCAAVAPVFLWQMKFNATSLAYVVFGFVLMQLGALLAPVVTRIFKIEPRHIAFVAMANVPVAVLFALAPSGMATMISFPLHVILQTILVVMASSLYHSKVENAYRGAAGSIVSLFDSLVVAMVTPVVAVIASSLGIAWGILLSAVFYLVITGWTGLLSFRGIGKSA